jgi:hypothetical protein
MRTFDEWEEDYHASIISAQYIFFAEQPGVTVGGSETPYVIPSGFTWQSYDWQSINPTWEQQWTIRIE